MKTQFPINKIGCIRVCMHAIHARIDIFCNSQISIVQEFFLKFMFGIFRVFLCTSGADESNLADGVKKRLNNTINSIIVVLGFWIVVDSEQTFTKNQNITSKKLASSGGVNRKHETHNFILKINLLRNNRSPLHGGLFCLCRKMGQ